MNVDPLIKKAIELSQIKTIRFFFRIIEAILFWYYSKTFKKKMNYCLDNLLTSKMHYSTPKNAADSRN